MYYWYPIGTATGEVAEHRIASITVMQKFWFFSFYIGFFLSAIAVITSYIYRKQRVFPTSMAAFVSVIDFIRWSLEMIKFSNIPSLNETLRWTPSTGACSFLFAYQAWVEIATVYTMLTLATIIYLVVVQRIDMRWEADSKYLLRVVGLFFFVTMAYTFIISDIPLYWEHIGASCEPTSTAPSVVTEILTFCSIFYEVILIGLAIRYIKNIPKQVRDRHADNRDTKKLWFIIFRLTTIIILQNLPRISHAIFKWVVAGSIANGATAAHEAHVRRIASEITISIQVICIWANSIFTIASNPQLRDTIRRKYGSLFSSNPYVSATSELNISAGNLRESKEIELVVSGERQ